MGSYSNVANALILIKILWAKRVSRNELLNSTPTVGATQVLKAWFCHARQKVTRNKKKKSFSFYLLYCESLYLMMLRNI